jgi:hypothetical protein
MAVTAGAVRAGARSAPRGVAAIAWGAVALLAGVFTLVAVLAGLNGALLDGTGATSASPHLVSALAQREIPRQYLELYQQAGQRYGVDWAVLAGIGKVECDHGRDPEPSCTRAGASNYAGAGGPMQFLASTWAQYGVDGNGDGRADRWNAADAIYSAASYLRAAGAPHDTEAAIFAYNRARWYVAEVRRWATLYRGSAQASGEAAEEVATQARGADRRLQGRSPTPVLFVPGARALLAPGDGHVALIPAGAPAVVQAMVVAGNELQDLRYGPGGHPDPRGAPEEDCSSSVNYVLYRSGVRPIGEVLRDNPLAQDYVHWGAPGPGRWVSIYSTTAPTPHVFTVIAGLRLDTSRDGTDEGPNRGEDGPRWRLLDHIPDWARWSVRHPPGL